MSSRKTRFLIIGLTLMLGCSFPPTPPRGHLVRIPVRFFPFKDKPLIKVEIEEKKYSLLVDLGSSHPIDLRKEHLQKIKKEPIGESKYVGIDGESHLCSGCQLPSVKLLNLTINGLMGFEENLHFLSHAQTWSSRGIVETFKGWLASYVQEGRMGWPVFKEFTCFFDFPQSSLYLAQNLDALAQEIHLPIEEYIKVPLEMETRGVFMTLNTDSGTKRFLLDTGATSSILRKSVVDPKFCQPYTSSLSAGDQGLGVIRFLLWDFSDQFLCDGILGVDFFKAHSICLDFPNKMAYIHSQ